MMNTTNKIALWAVIVAVITGVAVPVILHLLKREKADTKKVSVGRIEGDGNVAGDNAAVTIDKRTGIDGETALAKAMEAAEAKGRAYEQIDNLKGQLAAAGEMSGIACLCRRWLRYDIIRC